MIPTCSEPDNLEVDTDSANSQIARPEQSGTFVGNVGLSAEALLAIKTRPGRGNQFEPEVSSCKRYD